MASELILSLMSYGPIIAHSLDAWIMENKILCCKSLTILKPHIHAFLHLHFKRLGVINLMHDCIHTFLWARCHLV